MQYSQFIDYISQYKEEEFAAFQRKLIFTRREILGIRTPILRKIAKAYKGDISTLLSYPDTYYETVFIQLAAVAALPYEEFLKYLPRCVALMDNWALCDSFRAKCIQRNRAEFLPVLAELYQTDKEYFVRYVLVTLLAEYMDEEYLPTVKAYIRKTDTSRYYVRTAVAWLTAELLVQRYEEGVALLKERALSPKTQDKAIQKAIESYRITKDQKEFLRSLKIKKKGS